MTNRPYTTGDPADIVKDELSRIVVAEVAA